MCQGYRHPQPGFGLKPGSFVCYGFNTTLLNFKKASNTENFPKFGPPKLTNEGDRKGVWGAQARNRPYGGFLEIQQTTCYDSFWHPHRGARIGEAKHPGPFEFNLAITNPTAILHKQQQYGELIGHFALHAFVASETSATAIAQQVMQSRFQKLGMATKWSPPVADQFQTVTGKPSFRGRASGVCVSSKLPVRVALDTITPEWQATSRILHTIITIGKIDLQVIAIYGLTSSQPQAMQTNNDLVLQALRAANLLSLPAIIVGDFNVNPFQLECASTIQQQGYKDLKWAYQTRYGKPFPFTCRDATSPDTALISASLLPLISHIQVHPDFVFDTHKPVILGFHFQTELLKTHRLMLPKSWIELPIEQELIPTAYEATIAQTGIPATLEEWGGVVEKAIDTAYRLSQQQHHGIPWHQTEPMSKAYRGRCQPRTPQAIDIRSLTKMARPGDYNPTTEIYHFKTMRCIRQVRRVQSLQRRLRKTSTLIHMTDLQHEWAKICTDKSFGGCFVRWCQRHPDIGPLPRLLPSHDFLWTLEQVLRYETDRQIADDARVWRKKQEFFRQMDGHHKGYSQAFAQLRSRPFEPLQSLGISVEAEASMVPGQHFASMFLETDHGFQANHTATYHSHLCHVVSTSSDFITIRSEESTEEWPGEGTLTQQVLLTHPTHIMQALTDFWQPLWTRPTNEDDMISLRQLLSAIPDDLPAIRVDLDDEALWCSAVRELKSASGRGVDAISAAELQSLPDSCIRHLGKILASYSEGFPSWLMMARTIALPKRTGVIPPSQIRPITILAQTYRLWSKVVCKVILKHFAQTMPPEITGLLKHRGPMEAAYQAQVLHEIAMFQGACEGGFSLDLIKCFNTIGRPQALCLLRALGIPHAIIQVWHSSIEHLHRVWDIQGTYSEVLNCTNGVPEGDTFSVIVMLAVAYAWVCSVKAVAPHTRIGAYADNWGWATNRVCDHATILRATTQFVQAMGMSIDWLKSWYWATSRAHQQAIAQAIRCHTDVAVAKVAFAQDLGCTMTYHGPPNHQSATKRFQEGKKRLANLASMPHPFQVKCHLVKAGVIPVVMMGVEFVPIKPQAFSALRTAIANAILGQSVSRNSTMAVNCMPLLIDPELDTFMRSIRALKRYLARMMPQDDSVIFHLLAQHSGNPKDCRGPLGTLKCYLHRLGWSVLPGGLIAVSAFVSLPIRTTSMSDFTTWALRAWEADFAAAHSDRKTWQRLSPIDLTGTKQMVASFKSNQQAMLLNEISSAYQTAIQQKAWDPTIDGTCKHCGQPDTKHHRIFTCDALAEVRQSYSQLLSDLGEHDSVWHDLPVLFSQPEEEFIATLHYTQKPAMCSEDTLSQLNNLGHRVQCYTDGSCMFPASITTRFAAHAIIIDLCPDDDTRRFEAVRWLTTKQLPSTLMPLHLTRLPGRQVIHRAELYALVQVCENLHHTQVFSDSSYVITAFHRCQETLCVHHLEVHDNADLLIRLWYALQNGDHIVSKIKAHNDPAAERDSLQRYRMLGNQKANDMAIWANLHLHPAFVKELNAFHCAVRSNQDQLREFYKLQLELNCVRAKLEAAGQKDRPPQVVSTQHRLSALQQLQQWDIQEPWTWPTPSMDLSRESVWGPTMTSKLLQWLQQLRWPSNQNAPDEFGVTWLELACSFWMTVGCFIPVKRQDQRGVWRVIPNDSYATAMLHQVKFSEQAKMLSQWIDQVGDLIDTKIIPAYPRGLVRSLYTIGSGIQSSGVQVRPSFPWQEQVVTTLHLHFQNVKSQSMTVIPNFQLAPGVNFNGLEAEFRQSWDQRSKRVHDSARKIRSWRRCPQQQLRF